MKSLRSISGLILSLALTNGIASAQQYVSSTIAGTVGSPGYAGDGGPAIAAQITNPLCVAVDSKGNFYIADSKNYVIREVSAATGIISTVAGNGTLGFSGDGGPATAAQISTVEGLVVDSSGNIYISDTGNARIRIVSASGIISTYAGTGVRGDSGDHGPAVNARIFLPAGLALDQKGDLYIADYGNGTVREVSPTGIISTAAGVDFIGFAVFPGDGIAGDTTLGQPYSLAVDESGNLYVGDIGTSSIRKVLPNHQISTYVPQVSTASIAIDSAGNLYYADYRASTIVKVYPNGVLSTIAGNYRAGYLPDGQPGVTTEFAFPYSIALDSSSNIYVADYNNTIVRLLTLEPPSTLIVTSGASNVGFTASANGVSNVPVPVAPGEIVTLFGVGIGPATAIQAQPDANGFIETHLGGTTVTFNGVPAPIFSTGYAQVAAIVPYEISGMTQATVVASYEGNPVASATVPIAATSPQIFTPLSTGFTGGAVQNSDGTVNTSINAAADASTITIFITGEGQTFPPGVDGLVAQGPTFPVPNAPVTVTIGGVQATVSSYGGVLGQPAGVLQVVAAIPSSVPGRLALGYRNVPLKLIALQMTGFGGLDRPVLDETGLTGNYDFVLEFIPQLPPDVTPPPDFDTSGPSFQQALASQTGLKLVSQKGPVDVIVVDHIEKPSEN